MVVKVSEREAEDMTPKKCMTSLHPLERVPFFTLNSIAVGAMVPGFEGEREGTKDEFVLLIRGDEGILMTELGDTLG